MKMMSISEARRTLADLVDSAEGTIVTRNGQPVSVVIDYEYYRALKFDLDLANDPDRDEILEDIARAEAGDMSEFTDLEVPRREEVA